MNRKAQSVLVHSLMFTICSMNLYLAQNINTTYTFVITSSCLETSLADETENSAHADSIKTTRNGARNRFDRISTKLQFSQHAKVSIANTVFTSKEN
jgi:hypothetical protein